jgi:hypothetical protein
MIRLNVVVEGATEESFVNSLLSTHLEQRSVFVSVTRVLTSRSKNTKGGMTNYARAKNHLANWLKQDSKNDVRFTTMFDLYGLPRDFPGAISARMASPIDKVRSIETEFGKDINDRRFIPYIQLHEFEALLFSDLDKLKFVFINKGRQLDSLAKDVAGLNPEEINEGQQTAPSKRIEKHFPEYNKPGDPILIAQHVGLDCMRQKCPHFHSWLTRLEELA